MLKIYNVNNNVSTNKTQKQKPVTTSVATIDKSEMIMTNLDQMAKTYRVSFSGRKTIEEFKLGLSHDELLTRTDSDYFENKKMLQVDSPEYENLAQGDKIALKHLVKAAYILDEVSLKMDNEKNIPFRDFLKKEVEKGNEDAKMTLKLFMGQKGINALDKATHEINLAKGEPTLPGKALYPSNLSTEEFHEILTEMLDKGKLSQVKDILNQRSIVKRDGDLLKSTDYTIEYKKEFTAAAEELKKAAKTSTNKDFNQYLLMQAEALTHNDPMLDAVADKKWATLQDTPLEFTITRENYEDEMTGTVEENKILNDRLKKHGITPIQKDMLGIRVGIVNKKGTEELLEIKPYLSDMAENMPFKDEYEQNISADSTEGSKQTMVDVDLVAMSGDLGAYRCGITIAENLPNDDKMTFKIGGGRRNVYHRQIRQVGDKTKIQEKLGAILDPSLHKYYSEDADQLFTIGHENGHSLGPKDKTGLGKYTNIIEENKADIVSIAMLDVLTEKGMYTDLQKKQILTTFITNNMQKAKPESLSNPYKVRAVMQTNFFIKEGAIKIDDKGIITINMEKMVPTAKKMLEQIVKVQMSKDFTAGEKYVTDNFVWTKEMELLAENFRRVNKTLNGYVTQPLADKLAKED